MFGAVQLLQVQALAAALLQGVIHTTTSSHLIQGLQQQQSSKQSSKGIIKRVWQAISRSTAASSFN
jgi:hypothetical protein